MKKAVIIIPTYNERENIGALLYGLIKASSHIRSHACTFLVVDDNSPDGTQDEVKKLSRKYNSIRIISGVKEGLGRALLRGMKYALQNLDADTIIQMDADLSHDARVLPKFIQAIDDGADFVVGSRYIRGGSIPSNWGIHRKIFSIIGNEIVRFGLGYLSVHDWTGGYRAYLRKYVELAKDQMGKHSGYVFQIAFLHKSLRSGAKVVEVPIHFTDRKFGRSKIAPSEYIRNVIEYVVSERLKNLRDSPLWKMAIVGFVGFIINTVILELFVFFGFHPVIGSATGAELSIISNFILNNTWTFKTKKITGKDIIGKFILFNTTSIGALLLQSGTVAVGTYLYGVDAYRLFYILGVGVGLIWNFTIYIKVIWKAK